MQALPACAGDEGRVVFSVDRSLDFRICVCARELIDASRIATTRHDVFVLEQMAQHFREEPKERIGFSKTCGRLTVPWPAGAGAAARPLAAARDGIASEIRRRETGGNTARRQVSGQGTAHRAGRGWGAEPQGPDRTTDRRSLRCRLARAQRPGWPMTARDVVWTAPRGPFPFQARRNRTKRRCQANQPSHRGRAPAAGVGRRLCLRVPVLFSGITVINSCVLAAPSCALGAPWPLRLGIGSKGAAPRLPWCESSGSWCRVRRPKGPVTTRAALACCPALSRCAWRGVTTASASPRPRPRLRDWNLNEYASSTQVGSRLIRYNRRLDQVECPTRCSVRIVQASWPA